MEVKTIYTMGTSDRGWEEFLALLREYRLSQVIDVRSFPTSRFPHFAGEEMRRNLEEGGLEYRWLGESLGGYRRGGYQSYTTTPAFRRGIEQLERVVVGGHSVLVCAERFPWKCHRRFIARALEERGWRVIHIIERDRVWEPGRRALQDQGELL